MRANRIMKYYPVVFLTLMCIITMSLLVLTESITVEKVETQKDQQTIEMLKKVFSKANSYVFDEESGIYKVYDSRLKEIGYAFYAKGWSYLSEGAGAAMQVSSPIEILVGLKDKETINGIYAVTQIGDPYYSDLLIKGNYLDQFIGLDIEDAVLSKNGGKVDAVTRATLSSRAVVDIVRRTALKKIELIS